MFLFKVEDVFIVTAILILAFGLNSCDRKKVDIEYVKSALWQWDEGFKIGDGDFVDFDTTNFHTISHDTIFRKGVPRCIIIKTDKANYLMKVRSLTGKIGYYADSEKFTK
jgi:hypothetical protein